MLYSGNESGEEACHYTGAVHHTAKGLQCPSHLEMVMLDASFTLMCPGDGGIGVIVEAVRKRSI